MARRARILYLCTGNSCRSQMAEGWTRHLHGATIDPASAGITAKSVDPRAVRAMEEAGVDISSHASKALDDLTGPDFDFVITVCDNARESCPVFPGDAIVLHKAFDDPPQMTAGTADDEEAMAVYRRVRDEIREFVGRLPEILELFPGAVRS